MGLIGPFDMPYNQIIIEIFATATQILPLFLRTETRQDRPLKARRQLRGPGKMKLMVQMLHDANLSLTALGFVSLLRAGPYKI